MTKKLAIIGAFVVFVCALWTGAWFFIRAEAADRMDVEIARLAERGIEIQCPGRSIGGFPFRIEISCAFPTIDIPARATQARVGALRAVALVYNPTHVIVEADGPAFFLNEAGSRIEAQWRTLRASFRPTSAFGRFSVESDDLDLALTPAAGPPVKVTASRAEAHVRPAPDAAVGTVDLDLAISLTDPATEVSGTAGPGGDRLAFLMTVRNTRFGMGEPLIGPEWASRGGDISMRELRYVVGEADFKAAGPLKVGEGGVVNGTLELTAAGVDAIASDPESRANLPPQMAMALTGFIMLGRTRNDGGNTVRVVELKITDGQAKLGPVPLGVIPPLF